MLSLLFEKLITPRAAATKDRRQEYVLNVLLVGVILLILGLFLIVLANYIIYFGQHEGIHPAILLMMTVPFSVVLLLSRHGLPSMASYLFIGILFCLSTYPLAVWSILLPQGLLMYALLIVMSGVLLGTRVASALTLLIAFTLFGIVALGNAGEIVFDRSWMRESGGYNDAASYSAGLACIALVAWLFNKEIYRSLALAEASERKLRREHDLLEIKVIERTKALEKAQAEKMLELHKFAEFGRISSTLLHELTSPLTAVLLNLEMLETSRKTQFLIQARKGLDHIEQYVQAARRQLRNESEVVLFDAAAEIKKVVDLLRPQASERQTTIRLTKVSGVKLRGDSVRFNQIIANLIMNAIDSYEGYSEQKDFGVLVEVRVSDTKVLVSISDKGAGIASDVIQHIFEPFFTTKSTHRGTGIGLTITKQAIKEDFRGSIRVTSNKTRGTKFTITIPRAK